MTGPVRRSPRRLAPLLAAAVALGGPVLAPAVARAETDPAALARDAVARIGAAAAALEQADGARDRVAALTETVRAYESGLSALRAGLLQAIQRERALELAFAARRAEVARLLGVLTSIERSPAPLLLLHPAGPLGTARSGMILSEITPALQREADVLRAELAELAALRALQVSAGATLERGLAGAQRARTELSRAVSDRAPLPERFAVEAARMAELADSAATLAEFAAVLAARPGSGVLDAAGFVALRGEMPLPVEGVVLRGFGDADAAGIARPGLLVATAPAALVSAPAPATLRYVGPLLDYGNVMILEPAAGILLVLAGLGEVYGAAGDVVSAGAPLGLMGGAAPEAGEFLALQQEGAGALRSETLYIEVRRGESPEDPAAWFAVPQDR